MKALMDHAIEHAALLPNDTLAAFDSRRLVAGQIFFALRGHADGHDHVAHAIDAGASAIVVSKPVDVSGVPVFVVQDVLSTLLALGQNWRQTMPAKVIGLTGSCGKTSTRFMIQTLLKSMGCCVCATQGNLNNTIGVAVTLLSMRQHHTHAVIEMGASMPGDIKTLTQAVQPDVGLVLNAQPSHLAGLKSLAGVVATKGELYAAMQHGTAILNVDDAAFDVWQKRAAHLQQLTFGHCASEPDVGHEAPVLKGMLRIAHQNQFFEGQMALHGAHHVHNATAAIAVCVALQFEVADVMPHLRHVVGFPRRLQSKTTPCGVTVIDDTYNANPASFEAGLAFLAATSQPNKWVVCGDMGDLEDQSDFFHQSVLEKVLQMNLAGIVVYGKAFTKAAKACEAKVFVADTLADVLALMTQYTVPGDVVLVKGSRCMALDQMVDAWMKSEVQA